MGLIQKKDEKDEIDGIQIIERGEGPDGDEDEKIDLVAGTSAEHIAAGTTAEEEDARLEAQIAADAADENLMPEAQDEDETDADADDHASKHKKTMIAAFVVAVVIAAVVGFFIGNGGFGGKGVGSAILTEDQLDSTVASYSYNGKKSDITAREAIESQYSLDTVKDGDGNYTAPSADVILSYVRNKILLDAAEDEGITVSSKEMKQYAEDSIGTSDYKTMAAQYGVSKDQPSRSSASPRRCRSSTRRRWAIAPQACRPPRPSLLTATRRPRARTTPTTSSTLPAMSGTAQRALGRMPTAPMPRPLPMMPLRPIAPPTSRP